MNEQLVLAIHVILIGAGATLVMDLWALLMKRCFNIPSLNWAMAGRWLGHMPHGRFMHKSIAEASAIPGELAIGWIAHYAVGIIFAVLLMVLMGPQWVYQPSLFPALAFGLITVAFPFFLMQPGMGAGIAASKTPVPNQARLRSIIAHSVFGIGLYLSALLLNFLL